MRLHHVFKSAALALALAALVGCGESDLLTTVDSSQSGDALAMRLGADRGGRMGPHGREHGGAFGLFAGLNLTAEQRTQLLAIADQYRPQPATASAAPRMDSLLVAETLDVEALRSAMANRPAPPAAQNRLDFLAEARAVLTDEQRATLVARLKDAPAAPDARPRPEHPRHGLEGPALEQLSAELKLTAEQQAAYDAYQAKLESARPTPPDPEAMRTTMVSFLETGDVSALKALEPEAAPPGFPADEFIAWVQTLSFEQRKVIFAQRFEGPHHGPHGHF